MAIHCIVQGFTKPLEMEMFLNTPALLSIIEIRMQGNALHILLSDMEAALRAHDDD